MPSKRVSAAPKLNNLSVFEQNLHQKQQEQEQRRKSIRSEMPKGKLNSSVFEQKKEEAPHMKRPSAAASSGIPKAKLATSVFE